MASSLLPRLLRRAPAPAPPLALLHHLRLSPSSQPLPQDPSSHSLSHSQLPIFPTFPLFSHLHLDPILDPTPLPHPHPRPADPVLHADSVKKKRKRKMNKHKLRKLRKQLRLRT